MCIGTEAVNLPLEPGTGLHYPEQYAKPDNFQFNPGQCIRSFRFGSCSNGHKFIKSLVCGREYCPDCGKIDSDSHKRRKARWYEKIHSLKQVGYLVITVPYEAREYFKDRSVLTDFRTFVKRKLQRIGYNKGLIRYHYFGDCNYCKGHGCINCNDTGAGNTWNPHLNVIIEQGYLLKKEFLEFTNELKNDVVRWIKNRFKKIPVMKGNVNFSYRKTKKQINHTLNYVTRATFRRYDRSIAELLHGFKTSNCWGKFEKMISDNEDKEVNELVSLESGLCPCCGGLITWEKERLKRSQIFHFEKIRIDGGYYMILDDYG